MIGLGIAQKTIFAEPDHVTADTTTTSKAAVTVIDGAVLNSFPRSQTVKVFGPGTVVAAYGRTSDVLAWIGDATYNNLTLDPKTDKLVSTLVSGTEDEVPDPEGSDLWLTDYSESQALQFTIDVPPDISVLIVSDGKRPAPPSVSVTWLLDNSTPLVGPLVVGGGILLILGLIFMLWAVNHMRRARGPRRKQPKMPKLPRQPRYKPTKQRELEPVRGRRAARPSIAARIAAGIPVILISSFALGGCSSNFFASLNGDDAVLVAESTAPTSAAVADPALEPPAVTVPQAKRIVGRVAAVVAKADTDKDAELIATRLDGPALALRLANYTIRKIDTTTEEAQPIPAGPVKLILPQQSDSWPRTVFVVIQNETDETIAPVALMLIQDDPRAQYKVHYEFALAPGVHLPEVAPPSVGAARLAPDVKIFSVAPEDVGLAYGDILTLDVDSNSYDLFQAEGDSLRKAVGLESQNKRKAALPSTASITFTNEIGAGQIVALATNDSGAFVAVPLNEIETVAPVEAGAAINAPPDFAALSGKSLSTRGLRAVYGDQILFYVPSASSGGKIVLLGYSQGLIAATEL
jgi:hypothetical protein